MATLAGASRTVSVGPPLSASGVSPNAAVVATAPGQTAAASSVTLPAPVIVPEQASPGEVTIELRTSKAAPVDSSDEGPVDPVKVECTIVASPPTRLATSVPPTTT